MQIITKMTKKSNEQLTSNLFFLSDKATKRCLNKQVHIPGIDSTEQSQAKAIRATNNRNN